jgi:cytochrome b subunit of formate dehydrogenase
MKAATCSACHGSHDLLKADDPKSSVNRHNIPTTCGKCHPEEMKKYDAGIHGKAMVGGIRDAPTCIDCHNEHDIEAPSEEGSTVNPTRVVRSTCPRCHDNERIMKRYGVETGRQASYMDSYHGLARAAGSKVVASCTSCHGAHDILPQDDPASTTNHANLPKTCGKCHENASANFAIGAVHIMPTDPAQKALGIVRMLYIGLISLIIGGMIGHNTLLMIRRSTIKFKHELYGSDTYRRFSTGMIIGHVVLTIAFIALSVSGFALRYPESWWARQLFQGDTGLAARGVIHRIAAIVLVAVSIANAAYLIGTKAGRKELWSLTMGIKDLKDLFLNLAFIFGLKRTEPAFDRYSYIEKFEYWGMWWGTFLMVVTGFSMWFVNIFLKFLPKVALDIVALIHFYEAWLAVLTIVVWHLYYMIFDPQTYPMNWSWITGRITLDDFKERHPLEYERELAKKSEEEKH